VYCFARAVKGLVAALESRFLAARGAAIEGRFGAVGAMREALLGGAACDVLVVTAAMLAELRDQGVVAESPFAAIGEVRTGVAARSGQAVPRIDSAADLKAALVAAPALYVPDTVRSTAGSMSSRFWSGWASLPRSRRGSRCIRTARRRCAPSPRAARPARSAAPR
jgi:hypothetical protein